MLKTTCKWICKKNGVSNNEKIEEYKHKIWLWGLKKGKGTYLQVNILSEGLWGLKKEKDTLTRERLNWSLYQQTTLISQTEESMYQL